MGVRQLAFGLSSILLASAVFGQAPSFRVIDLGPLGFSFPGYISGTTGVGVGYGALNNSNQVGLIVTSNMGVNPNPTGFSGPLGGGRYAAALWDKGMLRDLRWSLPSSPINNPHFGSLRVGSNVSISSNGNVAGQCEQFSFADPSLPNFGPERCVAPQAVMFHNSTRTWKLIGTLSDNTSQTPFVRQPRESLALGVNASGVTVGNSRREPGVDPNDLQAYPRAFSFLDANPNSLVASNLATSLGAFPLIAGYDSQGNFIGPLVESTAFAVNDNGLAVGSSLVNSANRLHAPLTQGGSPICSPSTYPLAGLINFVPLQFAIGSSTPSFLTALGNICEVDGIAYAVSSNGNIGGDYSHSSWAGFPTNKRPFIIVGGVKTDIPIPAGTQGTVFGINAVGDAVGIYTTQTGERTPFLYRSGALYNLRDLVPANPPGMTLNGRFELLTAMSINDSGHIAGGARFVFNEQANLAHFRSVLLVFNSFCNSSIQVTNLPPTTPQAGVDIGLTLALRQASGGCNVTPVGDVRLLVNNQLVQTLKVSGGPEDPLATVTRFSGAAMQPGNNTVRVEYSGNGLYDSSFSTQDITSGPRCLASVATPAVQRGAFVYVNAGPNAPYYSQRLTIINNTGAELPANTFILIRNLSPNVTLTSFDGSISLCDNLAAAGTRFKIASYEPIPPGGRVQVTLTFTTPNAQTPITYTTGVIAGPGAL
jgi:hypothetical protein